MALLTAIELAAIPADAKIRHVTVTEVDKDGNVLSSRVETPAATYCWKVVVGKTTSYISGDHPLPCIVGEEKEDDKIAGSIAKVHPVTGEVKYGPADVRQSQYDAWRAKGIL